MMMMMWAAAAISGPKSARAPPRSPSSRALSLHLPLAAPLLPFRTPLTAIDRPVRRGGGARSGPMAASRCGQRRPTSGTIVARALPPVHLSDLPSGAPNETLMSEECACSVLAFAVVLSWSSGAGPLVVFVTDHISVDAFDAERAAGVRRRWLFFPGSIHAPTLFLHLPELAASVHDEFHNLTEPPLQVRSSPADSLMVRVAGRFLAANTILINSFQAIEPEVAMALQQPKLGRPPMYPIGLLILANNGGGG